MLEVTGYGTAYLRLAFLPPNNNVTFNNTNSDSTFPSSECYLFLNNEQGQSEESFLFRINYISVISNNNSNNAM